MKYQHINNLWYKAKEVCIQKTDEIVSGFNVCFDEKIPFEIQKELRSFVIWVGNNFNLPITLWVDFEYKHYLIGSDGKRVGYLFYWTDFSSYPIFENKDDIPMIKLPVRTEKSSIDEILCSFIEAITDYFAWICNEIATDFEAEASEIIEILKEYKKSKSVIDL